MSLELCLDTISRKFDEERDFEGLFDELSEIEEVSLEEDGEQDYHPTLSAFLERFDELLGEEEFQTRSAEHAVSNLRADLERIRDDRPSDDPLDDVFKDMTRYEAGTVSASQVMTTLSRYESLIWALRFQFEECTDPNDTSEIAEMMRQGLAIIEATGAKLRLQLDNGNDYLFDEIRGEFVHGTNVLRHFREQASFAPAEDEFDGDEYEQEEYHQEQDEVEEESEDFYDEE